MVKPKNSLQAVLEQQSRSPEPATAPAAVNATPAPGPVTAPVAPKPTTPKPAKRPSPQAPRPSRVGRKLVAGHFEPKVAKQLKLLAAEEETTVQALLEEALDLLFVKKGRGAIARDQTK